MHFLSNPSSPHWRDICTCQIDPKWMKIKYLIKKYINYTFICINIKKIGESCHRKDPSCWYC